MRSLANSCLNDNCLPVLSSPHKFWYNFASNVKWAVKMGDFGVTYAGYKVFSRGFPVTITQKWLHLSHCGCLWVDSHSLISWLGRLLPWVGVRYIYKGVLLQNVCAISHQNACPAGLSPTGSGSKLTRCCRCNSPFKILQMSFWCNNVWTFYI